GNMVFRTFHFCVAFLFLVMTIALPAESEEIASQEIVHLLQYIESSDCIFIRNGKEYTAAEAMAHIQKKYEYFKDRVKTSEDFIKYAATKSSISGKPYVVRCNGREIRNADWLNTELQKLRNRS
ncbi:MAG: DUF5329 domain-containing protein, partial [Desulfobulbales bacterium]